MLKKHRQQAEMSVALRDMEARMNAEKRANEPKKDPSPVPAMPNIGTFGAKLLACETLADARRLLGLI